MYIFKNALRCISRAKGRNLLIGIIVLVIALSVCLGLSVRQAAENARAEAEKGLSITASIDFDRQQAMQKNQASTGSSNGGGGRFQFDRDSFSQMMGSSSALTLEEYQKYATAESVSGYYYATSTTVNGSEEFQPVSSETETETEEETTNKTDEEGSSDGKRPSMGDFPGGKNFMRGMESDFTLAGYSGELAMTDFIDGIAAVEEGAWDNSYFSSADYNCMISQELAIFNDLAVGDKVVIQNPNNEEETYTLTVVAIYTDSSANEESFSMMGSTSTDPANKIYMSAAALQAILDNSEENSETITDERTGRERETKMTGSVEFTYIFENVADYEAFEGQARELGLDETYVINSASVKEYKQSLVPMETLSDTAQIFLIVILAIGAIILVVLNIFNVRERKYEIGVLTAMGMKKRKVATQFLVEIFLVTISAVLVGSSIGAVSSVPVTEWLLEEQVSSQEAEAGQAAENFGYVENAEDFKNSFGGGFPGGGGGFGGGNFSGFGNMGGGMPNMTPPGAEKAPAETEISYITTVSEAMNLTVALQMMGIALLLTVVAGLVSMIFVMRYEPLKILANRD